MKKVQHFLTRYLWYNNSVKDCATLLHYRGNCDIIDVAFSIGERYGR